MVSLKTSFIIMTHPFVVFLSPFLLAGFLLKLYFSSLILILFVKETVM